MTRAIEEGDLTQVVRLTNPIQLNVAGALLSFRQLLPLPGHPLMITTLPLTGHINHVSLRVGTAGDAGV